MVALFALPGSASAANFCVQGPCPSGATPEASSVRRDHRRRDAIVSPGRDRIEIGPGTPRDATNAGVGAGNPVDIVGAGQTATILVGSTTQQPPVLTVNEPSSTVSNLTLRLGSGNDRNGLSLNGASATRVTADGAPGAVTGSTGISVAEGATLRASRSLLPNVTPNIAVSITANVGETTTLEDVEAAGYLGVNASPAGTVNVRRVYVHDTSQGVRAGETGTVNVSSSLIRVYAAFSRALSVSTSLGISPVLNARHVTAVGDGSADSHGADAAAGVAGRIATINVRDSTLQGFANALFRNASDGTANLSVAYSNYPAASVSSTNTGAARARVTTGAGNLDTNPLFTNAAAGNFRLLPASPLIEAGDPAPLGPTDSATDLAGRARIADADANGTARSDMGAYERPAPVVATTPVGPVTPGPAPDIVRPVLSRATLSNTTFRVAKARTPVSAVRRRKAPRGTTLRYRLSETARVQLTVERRLAGRRVRRKGKRVCVRQRKSNRKGNRRCRFYKKVRTLRRAGKPGVNRVKFTGRIGSRKLAAGRYRMRLSATDGAGNRSAIRTLSFRIVR